MINAILWLNGATNSARPQVSFQGPTFSFGSLTLPPVLVWLMVGAISCCYNEDDDDDEGEHKNGRSSRRDPEVKKLLEQEPEMLPCYASASPLSPQPSSLGTPRLGPSIKVWDPYNVLGPPPHLATPPFPQFSRSFSSDVIADDQNRTAVTEVYLINHGEWEMSLRPELINGRNPDAALTLNGKRQARALAVFLNCQGVRFNAVYTSPLDRAKATAVSVCQETNFSEQQIQSSDALMEMSHGHWEGCLRSEICTPEISGLIDGLQPDFSAPSGESLRQVEFRMIQFLNETLLQLPEKLKLEFSSSHQNESQGFSQHNPHAFTNSVHDQGHLSFSRKKSGKSRLQVVTTTGDHYHHDDEISPWVPNPQSSMSGKINVPGSLTVSSCVGVFTHSVPIKCLLTGVLGCSPVMSHKICIDDSSVTLLLCSWKTGWQIKRLNDTAHLRLL
ncbi:hypothetical protein Nepgr_008721 [Nepenthes gracilis]|uniref:Uncharacterized protein n=1 Tax=Nepenthes gracilis TaxID=150966 RepID=A0AAD3S9J7_NEPGR|nr:hypothetical protein Nepgr_008721 [Nepenthes gracilis]